MGSLNNNCDENGKCACKPNVGGDKCDTIVPGYYNIDEPEGLYLVKYWQNRGFEIAKFIADICCSSIIACNCVVEGSEDETCDDSGQCNCKCNVKGEKCGECNSEYYSFPDCHGTKIIYYIQ